MEETQKINDDNMLTLGFAIRDLGSAFGHRRDNVREIIHDVQNAQRSLDTFMGDVIPTPELTPAGAELSRSLHYAMRKWMDGPLSSLLYTMISESRGLRIWITFVHGLIDNKYKFGRAFTMASHKYRENHSGTDDMFMICLIELWMERDGQGDVDQVVKHLQPPKENKKSVELDNK